MDEGGRRQDGGRLLSYLDAGGAWHDVPAAELDGLDVVVICEHDIAVDGRTFRDWQRQAGVRHYLRWFAGWAFGVN